MEAKEKVAQYAEEAINMLKNILSGTAYIYMYPMWNPRAAFKLQLRRGLVFPVSLLKMSWRVE